MKIKANRGYGSQFLITIEVDGTTVKVDDLTKYIGPVYEEEPDLGGDAPRQKRVKVPSRYVVPSDLLTQFMDLVDEACQFNGDRDDELAELLAKFYGDSTARRIYNALGRIVYPEKYAEE